MKLFVQWIDRFALIEAYLSGFFIVITVILIFIEIVLRSLFNESLNISSEYSGYFMVAIVFLSLSYALKDNTHIRVNILTSKLNTKYENILFIFVSIIAFLLCSFALYFSINMVHSSYILDIRADTVSQTPIYLTQIVIPIGLLSFDLQIIAKILKRFI